MWCIEEYRKILYPKLGDWRTSRKADRDTLVAAIVKAINAESAKLGHSEVEKLEKRVREWFGNHLNDGKVDQPNAEEAEDPEKKEVWGKTWNGQRVAKELYPAQYAEADANHSTLKFPERYNHAIKDLWACFDEDEQEELTQKAKDWNKEGPPPNVQAKTAKEEGASTTRKFLKYMRHQMGINAMVFLRWEDTEGETYYSVYETDLEIKMCTSNKGGYKSMQENWVKFNEDREGGFLNAKFRTYLIFGWTEKAESSDDSGAPKPKHWTELETTTEGYPILPQRPANASLKEMKKLIRTFVNDVRRTLKSSSRHGTVIESAAGHDIGIPTTPWGEILIDTSKHIDSKYLPNGIVLNDPLRMKMDNLNKVFAHWWTRQEAGKVPLQFLGAKPKEVVTSRKGKKPARYEELDDEDDEEEEEEEDKEAEADYDEMDKDGYGEGKDDDEETVPNKKCDETHAAARDKGTHSNLQVT
ncbi:hypothetical protein HGRIS_014782 [Hohenbuehelia grisea]|uniref:Uncharacterized protein n=1 Tax=Hohenbuehelia grisea TaxID=104357 RepID=A0ABR3IQQ8_9AGAR